jgi:very-short-patch-repair endonuclease
MRREPTAAEAALWRLLRSRRLAEYTFRRQHPIGPFIADFACIGLRLVAEADGWQHDGSADDAERTAWPNGHAWRVVRFWNEDILGRPEIDAAAVLVALREQESRW